MSRYVELLHPLVEKKCHVFLDGTGKKDASVPANGVLDMYHRSGQMIYKECTTDDEKINYVLSNWDRYVISIRGVKQQKNGKLRGNGMPTKKKVTDDQKPWVCYYDDKGVCPRGNINQIKNKKQKNQKTKKIKIFLKSKKRKTCFFLNYLKRNQII